MQRIFREYVDEYKSINAISRDLSRHAVPLQRKSRWGTWAPSHLHRLLGREAYSGQGWYGRERHFTTEEGRRRISQPKDAWIPLAFPPLVDLETWQRAQAMKKTRKLQSSRNTKTLYLLQHLLKCEACDLGFRVRTNNRNVVRKNGKRYTYQYSKPARYYTCHGMYAHGTKCRERPYIRAEQVEELVWTEVRNVLMRPEMIVNGLKAQITAGDPEALGKSIRRAERELRGVQKEEDRAISLHVKGKITEEQLERQRILINDHLETEQAKLESLRIQQRTIQEHHSLVGGITAWVDRVGTGLNSLTDEERRQLLRLVLDHVSIDSQGNVRIRHCDRNA